MNVRLDAIELDSSIQCRATINTETVNEYANQMWDGDKFPAVTLFGDANRSWIGDGWHRVLAAKQNGAVSIDADVQAGGRAEALKHALGANALHGNRRTNADKRRCVEIALREFPTLSSRAVAEMCGVSDALVNSARPVQLQDSCSSTRTGLDGKQRPARKRGSKAKSEDVEDEMEEQDETKPVVRKSKEVLHPAFAM
jgi:hypothetical protein